jgi:hypothetical protein
MLDWLKDLDYGSVPDYFVLTVVAGGLFKFLEEWRSQRRAAEELRHEVPSEENASVALLAAILRTPVASSAPLDLTVTNKSTYVFYDVEARIKYVGSMDLPVDLRTRAKQVAVLAPGESFDLVITADRWPESEYGESDFDWDLEYEDQRGRVWQRAKSGRPHLVVEDASRKGVADPKGPEATRAGAAPGTRATTRTEPDHRQPGAHRYRNPHGH